ncbi:MAG: hypothetical protein ACI8XB_003156 [Patiriisocius sp.]|jgi:hypothetical protein
MLSNNYMGAVSLIIVVVSIISVIVLYATTVGRMEKDDDILDQDLY